MRRWKMMFDRHGDVLMCEQIDGPKPNDGDEFMVIEERPIPRRGPRVGGGEGPQESPDGDADEPERGEWFVDERLLPEKEREPIVA